jgi:hypothetical protein
MATSAQTFVNKKEYLASYYQANKEKIKARVKNYYLTSYKIKWENATEDQLVERRRKCNERAAKTKPWVTRRKRRPEAYLLNVAKQRSLKKNMEFSITVEDLCMPEFCPLLGVKLDSYSDNVDVHPSIDRIDSSKGYVKGNVWIISHRANRIKSDATFEELIKIGLALQGVVA